MNRFILSMLVFLLVPVALAAQTAPGRFESYTLMRVELDQLVEERSFLDLVERFANIGFNERPGILNYERELRQLLPQALTIAELIRVEPYETGYRQELIGYRDSADNQIFLRMLLQERADGSIVVLRLSVNVNIDELLSFF